VKKRIAALALASVSFGAAPCANATETASVVEPRTFGHTIGDVLTQRILLQAKGRDVGQVTLPSAGRVDVWLERRPARIETDSQGRRWLVVDYQVTNAPRSLTRIALPALALKTGAGDQLNVPEQPASIGPLIAEAGLGGAGDAMQPDRIAAPAALGPMRRGLAVSLALLAATLLAWAGWWTWRNRWEASQLPFARAWRQLRLHAGEDTQTTQTDAAWRAMHRALDETAGYVVHARSLAALIEREPWLKPLQPQLERFYDESEARFFGAAHHGGAAPSLIPLCRALYRAERQRQR
jgi:mxaA protein